MIGESKKILKRNKAASKEGKSSNLLREINSAEGKLRNPEDKIKNAKGK